MADRPSTLDLLRGVLLDFDHYEEAFERIDDDDELLERAVDRLYDAGLRAEHVQGAARDLLSVMEAAAVGLAERLADREVAEAKRRKAEAEARRKREEQRKRNDEEVAKGLQAWFDGAALPADWRTMSAEQLNEAIDARLGEVADGEE